MSNGKKELWTLGGCVLLAAVNGAAKQPMLSAALAGGKTWLGYLLYYLALVAATLWLFVGAAALGRLIFRARGGAMAVGAALLFAAAAADTLLPLAVVAADNVTVGFGTLLFYNLESTLGALGWYAVRIAILFAVFGFGRAKHKSLDGCCVVAAVAFALLPALVELIGQTIPFLFTASRNQLAASGGKLVLEYLLYLVFGALGLVTSWLTLCVLARGDEPITEQ